MAKKSSSTSTGLSLFHKHHLLPSVAGGGVAWILSGVVMLGLAVFAAVWVGNMLSHNLSKK